MADTAFEVRYRQETIAEYEQRETLLRKTCTTEFMQKGGSAVFLVAGSNSASAVTRGVNGLYPARANNLTQNTASLAEWTDLVRATGFNIFASQGDLEKVMQRDTVGVVNRKVDSDIITELETATNDTGAAQKGSLELVMYGLTILGNNEVPVNDGNVCGVISPAFYAYLMQSSEFSSADFVNNKPFTGTQMMFQWAGVNWVVHPNLTGKGTNAEKCFLYHKSAIGHAMRASDLDIQIGYDKEQDYSFARATGFFASKLLQNSGVVIMNHDGSAYAAQ